MISATYIIVGFVALFTMGFSFVAATMLSRRKTVILDSDNIRTLTSYTVYDNHGGNIYEQYDEPEEVEEDFHHGISDPNDNSAWYSRTSFTSGIQQQPAPFKTQKLSRPAYLQFK